MVDDQEVDPLGDRQLEGHQPGVHRRTDLAHRAVVLQLQTVAGAGEVGHRRAAGEFIAKGDQFHEADHARQHAGDAPRGKAIPLEGGQVGPSPPGKPARWGGVYRSESATACFGFPGRSPLKRIQPGQVEDAGELVEGAVGLLVQGGVGKVLGDEVVAVVAAHPCGEVGVEGLVQ